MTKFAVTKPATNASVLSEASAVQGQQTVELTDFRIKLMEALQSSLDLHETVANFYHMLQRAVPVAGVAYRYPTRGIDVSLGANAPHKVDYALSHGDNALGEITMFRSERLSDQELALLEALAGMLILPLRNALLYRDALEGSLRDPLTNIGNRAAMELALKRELDLSKRTGQPMSLLVLDLDHFKQVNDTAGHLTGDRLLQDIAASLAAELRQTDQVFRYGGEEFVVILANTDQAQGLVIAERIRAAVAKPRTVDSSGSPTTITITVSIGVATSRDLDTRDQLFDRSDDALYRAKDHGRNRVEGEVV